MKKKSYWRTTRKRWLYPVRGVDKRFEIIFANFSSENKLRRCECKSKSDKSESTLLRSYRPIIKIGHWQRGMSCSRIDSRTIGKPSRAEAKQNVRSFCAYPPAQLEARRLFHKSRFNNLKGLVVPSIKFGCFFFRLLGLYLTRGYKDNFICLFFFLLHYFVWESGQIRGKQIEGEQESEIRWRRNDRLCSPNTNEGFVPRCSERVNKSPVVWTQKKKKKIPAHIILFF